MSHRLVADISEITSRWRRELNLTNLMRDQLDSLRTDTDTVDVVAIGKASLAMATSVESVMGERIRRRFVVTDRSDISASSNDPTVMFGEHPIPGPASLRAAEALLAFLGESTNATMTLFLVSGGASSLCALPSPPLTLGDMADLWKRALEVGIDITTLNQLRAGTSQIAGGALLAHVRSARSASMIMVDNVVSGAEWVASGLTYDFAPPPREFERILGALSLSLTPLGTPLRRAYRNRSTSLTGAYPTLHTNIVIADPQFLLDAAVREAQLLGYRIHLMGSQVQGDVREVCATWSRVLRELASDPRPHCVIGVGEVTVQVDGSGEGGRCQELAWLMAGELATLGREVVFAARASDGRDFLPGVAGGWVDRTTRSRAAAAGIDVDEVTREHDSYRALHRLDQLFRGAPTGWNLCDIYVALL